MMAGPGFRDRQEELRTRLRRLSHVGPRALVRQRLERQLRHLVEQELAEEARSRPAAVGEWSDDEGQPLHWWQK